MEEDAHSWIRRTKFSHTVYYRLDSIRLDSIQPPPNLVMNNSKAPPRCGSLIRQNQVLDQQRSLSSQPETAPLSETFKQARSDQKLFSSSRPRGREAIKMKLFNRVAKAHKPFNQEKLSPARQLASLKSNDKSRLKESSWTKLFEPSGRRRVTAVDAVDELTVDLSKLFLGHRFAHGAHSRLYHGMYNDEAVAVKIINLPEDDENGDLSARLMNQFSREVTLLSRLHHPNVIKLVAACRKPSVHCIITEYISEGSLRSYLHKLKKKPLPMQKLIDIALDVARGMEFIHSQGIIHRDLKPENVLIDRNFSLKIADFGIACEEAYCDTLCDDPGTYRWMAPEMIKRKSYGRKVDVYSFGLMLWEMVAGTVPYEDMTPIQAAFAVVNKNTRPVIPSECPGPMRRLIEQCWSSQAEKRPEFWEVVKVLEEFKRSIGEDGSLSILENSSWECEEDHKKRKMHYWIQKFGPLHSQACPMPKPKFI